MLARRCDDLPPLALRDPAPEVERGQRQADRAGAARQEADRARHDAILATLAVSVPAALVVAAPLALPVAVIAARRGRRRRRSP